MVRLQHNTGKAPANAIRLVTAYVNCLLFYRSNAHLNHFHCFFKVSSKIMQDFIIYPLKGKLQLKSSKTIK